MKKFLSILSVLVLGLAFAACDFGSEDDTDAVEEYDSYVDPDEAGEDDTFVGYENDWELVMIIDAEENTSGGECNAGNPGADIDAVEFFRDGVKEGWVHSVEAVEENFATPCDENDKDDPDEMVGPEDGVANSDDGFSGYFSLNGRKVTLLMSSIMENGDDLVIYEMYNADNPDATIEDYQVFLGYLAEDGEPAWTDDAVSDWATGQVDMVIDGLW